MATAAAFQWWAGLTEVVLIVGVSYHLGPPNVDVRTGRLGFQQRENVLVFFRPSDRVLLIPCREEGFSIMNDLRD